MYCPPQPVDLWICVAQHTCNLGGVHCWLAIFLSGWQDQKENCHWWQPYILVLREKYYTAMLPYGGQQKNYKSICLSRFNIQATRNPRVGSALLPSAHMLPSTCVSWSLGPLMLARDWYMGTFKHELDGCSASSQRSTRVSNSNGNRLWGVYQEFFWSSESPKDVGHIGPIQHSKDKAWSTNQTKSHTSSSFESPPPCTKAPPELQ